MAALLTSVMDNVSKVSEYILSCRQMGISILPPDINEGESGFSVSGKSIRYGLSAIKSVGKSVVEQIVAERITNGLYHDMEDFIDRMSNKEVNKRTLENFIKSGALDTLPGTRKQKLLIAPELLDQRSKERKNTMEGQITLFDLAGEEEKSNYQITFPDVGEFGKEDLLAFEKETLGIYVSGHPLEAYEETWRNHITAVTVDFIVDEETQKTNVQDGAYVTIGGMITGKNVKTTRNNKMMAFLTLEDLVGSVEVIVFPKDYESKRELFVEDSKVFIQGRASVGDDPVGKLICERVIPFSAVPKELWLKFPDKDTYVESEREVLELLRESEGSDSVIIYLERERAKKVLPANWNVNASDGLIEILTKKLGEINVRLVEKKLEKIGKMN